jgi:DNA-binding SARP family transcriptional activator/tetratricopeptide (TPR) repeat protein
MLHVRLLGELQIEVDGRAIEPPASRRARALLAWLALHPGEHARGSVAARFWPDVLDTSARASLRSAAWTLRRELGPAGEDALSAGRDRIGVTCETDLAQFEAHIASGRLQDAVELCDGPLLADLDDDWVLEARDEHAERLGSALARLAIAAASPQESVAWARRRLTLDPLDEEAARDLMRRLTAAGDRAGALAVYERLSDRLRTGLGLAPSADTRALAAGVRDEQPAAAPGAAGPAPVAAVEGLALVGRETELAALLELWETVRGGGGAVALIGGEGGIGKTRLATELVARARAQGARGARCTAVDFGGAPPFGPWAELLAGLAREIDPPPADADWPEDLARLAPSLPRRLGRAAAAGADVPPDLARARLFEAAVELAEHATADRPLVLFFDDVHLADAQTIELAAYVARRIERMPVLFVLTRRMTPRREAIDALAHSAGGRGVTVLELDLEPLARADVERLIAAVAALDAPDREHVVAAADGNPLLALESARASARGDSGPPSSLRAGVRAALGGLSDPARRAAELAAVAGRHLERAELGALAEPEAVLAAMDCGLFRSADGTFGFRHALLREAAYADLDDARRVLLHELLGNALTHRAAEAAHHLRLAHRDDLAAGRLAEAATDAARATAFAEAAAYLLEAVELRSDDSSLRLDLAAAFAQLGQRESALTQLEAGLRLTDPDDASAQASVHLRAARWFQSSLCDPTSARNAARRGLAALDAQRLDDRDLRAELLLVRAWCEVTIAGASAADSTLAEFEALGVDLHGAPMYEHDSYVVRGFVLLAQGHLAEAEAMLAKAGKAGEVAGRPDMAYGGWAHAAIVAAAALSGNLERALEHADHCAAIVAGYPIIEFEISGLRGYVLARLGRHAEVEKVTELMSELAARLGSAELTALADHDTGLFALMAGDHERAQELLGRALEADPPVQRAEARLHRAEALARLGRPDEADAEIRAAVLEPVRPSHRPAVLVARMAYTQALSARARGDRSLAETRLAEAAGHWRRLGGNFDASRDHSAALVDLGRLPVTGVVDPDAELARIATELRELQAVPT